MKCKELLNAFQNEYETQDYLLKTASLLYNIRPQLCIKMCQIA